MRDIVERLLARLASAAADSQQLEGRTLTSTQRTQIADATSALHDHVIGALHPHELPSAVFDPADPALFGQFAAIALLAQSREPLATVRATYGSGVYALYYVGNASAYLPISRTETPIYIGKAQGPDGAQTLIEQGTPLTKRLAEHRRSIEYADTLNVGDFECRRLVIAPGWEEVSERALMRRFHSVWNDESKIMSGFGKHGDAATTRANKRSPWDTMHPGRPWADGTTANQREPVTIMADIALHFDKFPPVQKLEDVVRAYVETLTYSGTHVAANEGDD